MVCQVRRYGRPVLSVGGSEGASLARARRGVQRGLAREVHSLHPRRPDVFWDTAGAEALTNGVRAFADFCLSSVVLHVFAFNFLG